jgi:DNA-directed RNA polymerase subunit E'/Rpb7
MAKYIETKFLNYHSNVVGNYVQSNHPDKIQLPSGKVVDVDGETRFDLIDTDYYINGDNHTKKGRYIKLDKEVRFRVESSWENDCNSNGSRIRWEVPKGSKFIWLDDDGDVVDEKLI